eukprot:jgi/Phyca11/531479/estExt2_fgenesh1_pg.C_PHYCAscaffold_10043
MASQGGNDHHSSGNPRPVAPTLLLSKKPRSSDDARRNRINMEKMIMRNVATARNSTKNRAQQIVEALKKKRQLQEEAAGPGAEEAERATKRKKASSPPSDTAARTAVAAGILSPARRSNTSGPGFTSPTRRHNYSLNMKSPTPQMASPARARVVNPLHISSPVDVAPPAKSVKVVRTAKSPFQSFQAKFNKSPAKAPRPSSSPAGGKTALSIVPRSGPMMVNLAQPDESIVQQTTLTSTATTCSDADAVSSSDSSVLATSKDGDTEDFQQFQKHFHSNVKLRGFADVTTYIPPAEIEQQENNRSAYYILTGLGVGNLNLWRFVEPGQHQEDPIWEHLQNFGAGGNTAMMGA